MKPAEQSLYHQLGGEAVLREFVGHFYNFMDSLPEVKSVREMHAADLTHARKALYMFLSGMFGGPPLYTEAYGHPHLRRKHLRFTIGNSEREQWLLCAKKAADKLDIDPMFHYELMFELTRMVNHLCNQGDCIKHEYGLSKR